MEDFGSYLKSERELRGVPLEEISATTKIHIRFLQALEDNQFNDLPGEVFIKGYIRSYAKVIGSNENEMLSAYDEAMKEPSSNKKNKSVPVKDKTLNDKSFMLGLGLSIIFLAGVGWGGNILIQKSTGRVTQSKPEMLKPNQKIIKKLTTKDLSDSAIVIKNELTPSKKVENFSAKKNTVFSSSVNPNTSADISNNENEKKASNSDTESDIPLTLNIKAKNNVWFNIAVDESNVEDFILPKGATKTFYGKDNFRITVGNRYVVDLQLNGKTLSLPDEDENHLMREFIINSQLIE